MRLSSKAVSESVALFPYDQLPDDPTAFDQDGYVIVATAARAWLSIQEKAETLWWCEEHSANSWDDRHLFCLLSPGDPEEKSCRMVERRLI